MRFRTMAVLVVAILVTLVLYQAGPWRGEGAKVGVPDSAGEAPLRTDPSTGRSSEQDPAPNSQSAIAGPQSKDQAATNWLLCLLTNNCDASTLPREAIDRWLASGRTNAEDLLAARQAGGGVEFLRMALTNFPNDPRVLFAASALDDGPEARRDRLDRFKAAAPDNALADYLSARDHLKNGQTDLALADLMEASGKNHFQDYTLDAMQNTEDLYLQAGKSPAEAKALGTSTALLPHLAQLKGLAQEMGTLQRQYLAAGDSESAEHLAQMGFQLGQQLTGGEGSHELISQLVGIAVDKIVLNPLDPERSYDFLQGNVRDQLDQLTAQRNAIRQTTSYVDDWLRNASEPDLISYFDRLKIYGESSALAWMRQRQQQP